MESRKKLRKLVRRSVRQVEAAKREVESSRKAAASIVRQERTRADLAEQRALRAEERVANLEAQNARLLDRVVDGPDKLVDRVMTGMASILNPMPPAVDASVITAMGDLPNQPPPMPVYPDFEFDDSMEGRDVWPTSGEMNGGKPGPATAPPMGQ